MSIFNQSFDPEVREQLELREEILSGKHTDDILYGRSNAYLQYANNKTPFIRLSSGVDITNEKLKNYFGVSQNDELATKYILEGGTLSSIQNSSGDRVLSKQRSTFNDIYGNKDLGGTEDFGLRPMPGITGISVKSYGDKIATLRIATVNIECYTLQQLEALELLYMRPGYRVLLEWGHTIYFTSSGTSTPNQTRQAVDIIKLNTDKRSIINKITQFKQDTKYNYDGMLGKVRNFSWEAQTDGSYKCMVEIISLGDIIDSLKVSVGLLEQKNGVENENETLPITANNIFLGILNKIEELTLKDAAIPQGYTKTIKYSDLYSTLSSLPKRASTIQTLKTFRLPTSSTTLILCYITLQDFLKLINDVCIFREGEEPIIKILDTITSYYDAKCLSHPYQLSGNPYKFLISPYYKKDFISYGPNVDTKLNTELTDNFPYRIPNNTGFELLQGNMFNILIEIEYIKKVFESLIKEESNKYNVYLKDFIQTILNDFNASTGFVNDLSLVMDPTDDNQYMVIDLKFTEASINQREKYYTLPLMGIGNAITPSKDGEKKGGTYVRSYRLNTQLTNNIATIVSINAQVDVPPIDGYETSVFNAFNQGIKDRLQQEFISSVNGTVTSNFLDSNLLYKNLILGLRKINLAENKPFIQGDETTALCANIQRYIDYTTSISKENRITFSSFTPVPLKFNCTIDGITGLRVGQIFLLPLDRLPHQYKIFDTEIYGDNLGKQKVGFIIFGINHNVSRGEGWTTDLDCQMVMLNPEKFNTLSLAETPLIPLDMVGGYQIVRVDANGNLILPEFNQDNELTRNVLTFNSLKTSSNSKFSRSLSSLQTKYKNITWRGYRPVIEAGEIIFVAKISGETAIYVPYVDYRSKASDYLASDLSDKIFRLYDGGPSTNNLEYKGNGVEYWEANTVPFTTPQPRSITTPPAGSIITPPTTFTPQYNTITGPKL
jgi:hypothetical protein